MRLLLITLAGLLAAPGAVHAINCAAVPRAMPVRAAMLAPIAPAFAEECWALLHSSSSSPPSPPSTQPSIFQHPFPTREAVPASDRQTCTVQENGKLRFAVSISKAPEELLGKGREAELREWVLGQIEGTEEGERWLGERKGKGWTRVVCVRGGRTVNFVG